MMPLSAFEPEMLAIMIPIVALMIPIVAILTGHQRKMAEIIHGSKANAMPPELIGELHSLRQEVNVLRERVNQQTIALDSLSGRTSPPTEISKSLEAH